MIPAQLIQQGFVHNHYNEYWEDVGGPESGPRLIGHPECDMYTLREKFYTFEDGVLVEEGTDPYWNYLEEVF